MRCSESESESKLKLDRLSESEFWLCDVIPIFDFRSIRLSVLFDFRLDFVQLYLNLPFHYLNWLYTISSQMTSKMYFLRQEISSIYIIHPILHIHLTPKQIGKIIT